MGGLFNWRPDLVTCLDCLKRIKEGENQEAKDECREDRIGGADYEIFNTRSFHTRCCLIVLTWLLLVTHSNLCVYQNRKGRLPSLPVISYYFYPCSY